MALQSITNINIDFVEPKYIMINAKQYDDCSRLIYITCYNDGSLYNLNAKNHTAFIKFRKADRRYVYNFCDIDHKGRIIVGLTEQMLAAAGICYAEIVVLNRGNVKVNADTGCITIIDQTARIATMTFEVNVYESTIDDSLVESSDEFFGLNDTLDLLTADFSDAVKMAKSWAVGTNNTARDGDEYDNSEYYSKMAKSWAIGSTGVRTNENINNSKYYSEQAGISASNADESEANALSYMNNTNEYMNTTNSYMNDAKTYMNNANEYMSNAESYMDNAKTHMDNAKTSETNAATSEVKALVSEQNSKTSETNAATSEVKALSSEQNAKASEINAVNSAKLAQSYAIGGTDARENEGTDNAKYYYEAIKNVVDSVNGGFILMGTISFSELATAEKIIGYTYNIRDNFITDETFAEGAGHQYTAGVNVYCRSDGMWDCFGGAATPIADVDEVKTYLGI